MMGQRALFMAFGCVRPTYRVEGEDSLDLLRFVLDSEPALAETLFHRIDDAHTGDEWSSHGDSMCRLPWRHVAGPRYIPGGAVGGSGALTELLQESRD